MKQPPSKLPLEGHRPSRAFTPRAVLLGALLVLLLSAYVPYQYIIGGAGLEGGYMPLIGFMAIGLMVVVNAALIRRGSTRVFTPGEQAVVLGMLLAVSGVIGIGIFRQLPGNLVGLWFVSQENLDWDRVLREMNLPEWIFPKMQGETPGQKAASDVVRHYVQRAPLDDRSFWNQWFAVPWSAWLTPAITWAAFGACIWGACICLVLIFRRQWVENERLPFPIAQVYLSLIEPPERGSAFNALLRTRSLWIACAAVFLYRLFIGLHEYQPTYIPELPKGYDLTTLFSEQPWTSVDEGLKKQNNISFEVIAICLFVTTKVSFSLWFFYILVQVARLYMGGTFQREITDGMEADQTLGAFAAYGLAAAWIARRHLAVVLLQMLRGARASEPSGKYLPYVVTGWGVVAFTGGMSLWLHLAGCTAAGAVFISVWLLFCLTALARLVAETGLANLVYSLTVNRWFLYALQDVPKGVQFRTTTETYFFSRLHGEIFLQDLGHSLSPHVATSLRVADDAIAEQQGGHRRRLWLLIACMALSIAVGYVIAGAGMLHMQYNYAVTLDKTAQPPNDWGTLGMPRWHVISPVSDYAPPREGPLETHSRLGHLSLGAVVTLVCGFLRLRFETWPLHPVGFILVYGWGINQMWFSIFLGWLLKASTVRWGGASALRSIRPFFIGLIIGDAASSLFWLGVSLTRLSMGLEYYAL